MEDKNKHQNETTPSTDNSIDRLDILKWSIDRIDQLRSTVTSRASIVVSADAILVAGITFLLDRPFPDTTTSSLALQKSFFLASSGISLLLLLVSLYYSLNSMVFVWKRTEKNVKVNDLPKALFFHPSDTVAIYKGYDKFRSDFLNLKEEDFLNFGTAELLMNLHSHTKRYQFLRNAIRILVIALVFLLGAVGLYIFAMTS